MLMEVPGLSLDGSIARYTCIHDPTVTFQAVCRRDLNSWYYNYTMCPHPENLFMVGKPDRNKIDKFFKRVTDGDLGTCESKPDPVKFWFANKNVDIISFNMTFGTLPADLEKIILQVVRSNDDVYWIKKSDDTRREVFTDLESADTIHIEYSQGEQGSYGRNINVKGVLTDGTMANLSICEINVTGNYRNGRCNGPLDFKYGTEAYFDSEELRVKCLPGFYHHKGVDFVKCDDDTLNWHTTYIVCAPEEALIRTEASNPDQKALFDLQDDTCYTLSEGTDRILGVSPSPGNNMVITAISFKFKEVEQRRAFVNPVFKMDGVMVNPNCVQRTQKTLTITCTFNPAGKGEEIEIVHNSSSTISLCEIHVIGHINAYECFPQHPYLYQGKMNHTIFGHACERWDGVPASHPMTFDFFPDSSRTQAENYCRDPNKNQFRPWCFIKNYTEEQLCPVVKCEDNCSKQKDGKDYGGQLNVTIMGTDCVAWSSIDSNSSVQNLKSFTNYCRNPGNGYSSPWCFTGLDGTFERCNNIQCPKEFKYVHYNQPEDFTGHLWFPECYWFGTDRLRLFGVNVTDDWLQDWNIQNNSRLYCFGSDDLTLTELHIESYDLPTTTITTEPTTVSTTTSTTSTTTIEVLTTTTATILTDTSTASTLTVVTTSTATDAKISSLVPATTTTTSTKPTTSTGHIFSGSTTRRTIISETQCFCKCNMEPSLLTDEIAEERIAQINKELYIEKQKLTSSIRKLTSAHDERPSATYLGSSAIAIFSCVMLLVVLPDLFKIIYYFYTIFRNRINGTSGKLVRL
ncbi:hypothetical protein LOTGIDRAFT_167564 [Lottia gigantea]|uniref:Kringle domain-containing protein n=1 Tax=Lottia gigantea TaxID=225164 RepID=V3ZU03_LOTGI|nr:hypothetical protein LOTGIDRAFT_167564 [Lottia gigantea]ESO86060.1 hypothetical protein LOTGIDRAFT_167564 [Lottia gigantea]